MPDKKCSSDFYKGVLQYMDAEHSQLYGNIYDDFFFSIIFSSLLLYWSIYLFDNEDCIFMKYL